MTEPFRLMNDLYVLDSWMKKYSGLVAGFTTRNGGISSEPFHRMNLAFHVNDNGDDVCENRRILAKKIGFPLQQWVSAEQTHGKNLRQITKHDRGKGALRYEDTIKDTDGFYTEEKGVLLTMCYADCVPIYFLAPKWQRIGIVHSGWKGTVQKIAGEMATKWLSDGIDPTELFVAIGPSICQNCYQVDDRVIRKVNAILSPNDDIPYVETEIGRYQLDLKALNLTILKKAGVPKENILVTSLCTSCHHEFYSHRRDNGKTGRMLGFIGWKGVSHLESSR
ncbi:MAG: peptidoglycan editing factor PgeF [Bacillales bacterium]|nr:peptidoglycan editing factor PgeF [Bacillales bacterium]